MKKTILALSLALAPAAASALSPVEMFMTPPIAGVSFRQTAELDGKKLAINGRGLRVKVVFKVYAAALYSEKTSSDPEHFFALPGPMLVELRFLRDVSGEDVAGAIGDGFAKNLSAAGMEKLSARLADFTALIPDVKKGGELSFLFRPGRGVEVLAGDKSLGEIKGDDFSEGLLRVWLGEVPADPKLKRGLLGL
ncbi:MAG: chalcone isomerase family protein [Elusimicrobiota bacterium]|jgi:hypothetical protein